MKIRIRIRKKENLRLKIYEKIRNGRLKLEPSVLIKKRVVVTPYFPPKVPESCGALLKSASN